MKIIKQSWSFLNDFDDFDIDKILSRIEETGRTAYKTEEKITDESYEKFIRGLVKSGHFSVLEHGSLSIRIITNRAIANEIVRHRLVSYTQESTRYCNYSNEKFGNEITVILPSWFYSLEPIEETIKTIDDLPERRNPAGRFLSNLEKQFERWIWAIRQTEYTYYDLLKLGQHPEQARGILPLDLKTELVMTANLTEWRHILKLRTAKDVHPQCRELFLSILQEFYNKLPIVFEDILIGKVVIQELEKAL